MSQSQASLSSLIVSILNLPHFPSEILLQLSKRNVSLHHIQHEQKKGNHIFAIFHSCRKSGRRHGRLLILNNRMKLKSPHHDQNGREQRQVKVMIQKKRATKVQVVKRIKNVRLELDEVDILSNEVES